MEDEKKDFSLSAVLLQSGIIVVLVIGILVSLNYFNLLPLSSSFSFLSFLPKEKIVPSQIKPVQVEQKNTAQKPNIIAERQVISSDTQTFVNKDDKKYLYQVIKTSSLNIPINTKVKIDAELTVTAVGDEQNINGLLFGDDLAKTDAKYLMLFYYPKDKSWDLGYRHGDKKVFLNIAQNSGEKISTKISLSVSLDGTMVYVGLPNGGVKTLNLPESMYEDSRRLFTIAQAGPKASLEVTSLKYQTTN